MMAMAVALAACETGQAIRPVGGAEAGGAQAVAAPHIFATWTDAVPPYRIGEGDKLKVGFWRTPEFDEEVVVRPDGYVSLKATGDVLVADLTPPQASERVAGRATRLLRDPDVTVAVDDAISARVYVGGDVLAPGVYRIEGRIGIAEALTLAGGITPNGRMNEIVLIRRDPQDRPMMRTVDLRGLLEGRLIDLPIVQGDILFVPRSRIAEVNLWVAQFIEGVVPFQSVFQYSISRNDTSRNTPF
ncbi:sugar ABC transporter substrate-binding protein [Tistrella bauzanensis]|uniref:Sugar ABC transporter substrate-binding protein n=1 Tax=Tistrella bauzanensis TaxID=657419 RepID=A0ABQ1IG00_9PROT|nr:polysaccharide biosynthesis/export family protein [Tistrella bauzanensis]GGB38732.1 sugar ABC transporter substrate-binding protein [Tistrella bauzanensis]